MNKKLGPGILLLLALVLLYFGGTSGGALGAGLSVGGLVCLVLAIVGGIKKLFGGEGIEKRTKSTARAMLSSFLAVRTKHNYSIESASDKIRVYTHVLKLRNYSDDAIQELLSEATKISKAKGSTQGISLNTLVYVLVAHEYTMDTQKQLTELQLEQVDRILSEIYKG